jgi:hypothetical protein
LDGVKALAYEIASLVIQTALCVYFLAFKWRVRSAKTVISLVMLGLFLLVVNEVLIVLYVPPMSTVHGICELLETFGFAFVLLGAHTQHTHQLAVERIRREAAERLRSVLPEQTA